jgi:hypothetical protein
VTASSPAADVSDIARQHTDAAISALATALACPGERVPAAIALLAVGWGQPTLPVAVDTHGLVVEFRDGQPPARAANGEDSDDRSHVVRPVV